MPIRPSRREALRTGATVLAGCSLTARAERKADAPGWIDAHVHIWTDDLKRYPLAEGFTKAQMKPATFTPAELFAHCEKSGVRRINLIQMSYYRYDNSYMLDMMAKHPGRFAGTGIVDVSSPDLAEQMRRLRKREVRALRVYPSLAGRKPVDWLQPEGFETMFKTAAKLNQAVSCLIRPDSFPELDRMCARHPDTPVIIDHMGLVGTSGTVDQKELDALRRLARHKRVMLKVGAFYAFGKAAPYDGLLPLVRAVIEAFGPERCMWESDCPFQVTNGAGYEASVALIRDRCDFLSPADKDQILRKTAETFFFA
jgi:predicted TIM-barrel fold metal-dependent hydrolase